MSVVTRQEQLDERYARDLRGRRVTALGGASGTASFALSSNTFTIPAGPTVKDDVNLHNGSHDDDHDPYGFLLADSDETLVVPSGFGGRWSLELQLFFNWVGFGADETLLALNISVNAEPSARVFATGLGLASADTQGPYYMTARGLTHLDGGDVIYPWFRSKNTSRSIPGCIIMGLRGHLLNSS